jgi:peptidoglycan-N-acetylglucosamine deacetylase
MLERLIDYINGHDGVRWATMEEIADDFIQRYPRSEPNHDPGAEVFTPKGG